MTAPNLDPTHEIESKAWTVRIANIINRVAVMNTVEVTDE